jgi:hypothetical protein
VPRRSQPPSKGSRGVPSGSSVRQTEAICTWRHRARLPERQGEESAESHPSLSQVQSGPSAALTGAALAGCRTGRTRSEVNRRGGTRIGTETLSIGSFSSARCDKRRSCPTPPRLPSTRRRRNRTDVGLPLYQNSVPRDCGGWVGQACPTVVPKSSPAESQAIPRLR